MSQPRSGETTVAIEATAADWIARRDAARSWTSEEESELRAWIAASPAHRIAWLRMSAAWRRLDALAAGDGLAASDELATTTVGRVPTQAARGSWRHVAGGWRMAAGIALAVGIASLFLYNSGRGERFATNVGDRASVTLADGSHVTLNTDARGRAIVNETERRFWLEQGEAYFEVAHDPSRPFEVLAGRDRVTVLGTRFSVRHEGGRTEVTVLEGRVRFTRANSGSGPVIPVVLTRNESAVSIADNLLRVGKTEQQVANELSWREGRLVFDQTPLGEIAAQFNRYNEVQMVVEGDAAMMRFSGTFDTGNVAGFARLAQDSFGLAVYEDRGRIVVTR